MVQNLDRWGADEILLVCIDRGDKGPHTKLLREISEMGVTTPIIYAGGIRTQDDAIEVIKAGADRIAIDAGWKVAPDNVIKIHEAIGAQAVIASVPVSFNDQKLNAYDYVTRTMTPFPDPLLKAIQNNLVSEIIVTDYLSEGSSQAFNLALLEAFPSTLPQLIAFGGVHTPEIAHSVLSHPRCVAVGIGNYLSYQEHAMQKFKVALNDLGVREPQYYPYKTEQPIYAPDL